MLLHHLIVSLKWFDRKISQNLYEHGLHQIGRKVSQRSQLWS